MCLKLQLSPVDLYNIDDWLSAYRARCISTLMYAKGTPITHAHVTAHVEHAVRRPLQADCTLVGWVVLALRFRCSSVPGRSSGCRNVGTRAGLGRYTAVRDCSYCLRRRSRKWSHTGKRQRQRCVWIDGITLQCGVMRQGSWLLRRQGRRRLDRHGSYHRRWPWRGRVASRMVSFTMWLPLWRAIYHT